MLHDAVDRGRWVVENPLPSLPPCSPQMISPYGRSAYVSLARAGEATLFRLVSELGRTSRQLVPYLSCLFINSTGLSSVGKDSNGIQERGI